ncbi:FAD/NAD(P)-binding domain-containing protein [Laetiporus sulphureus 93-53]|uniref:FAD/NAD(P)-binding domain-containing protein n=1 Tax=Laetiporus sulphureus 93-53 TaxID=1314785 RepID=A0A165CLZ0_9APHY|nr:FAD/NAD(P)-binding domain-containing protein [Laetiporus sulphureus 93-53]KZT03048.1 FAD/NAD(P)-binding domain-containing protein [Laetiporus sulphureus 93-53]
MATSQKAPLQLHVLIVGCGLGGLAAAHCIAQAGHKVTLFESAPAIGEVGAGIQVSPNITRLLIRWGLGEKLAQIAVKPDALVFRRYSTGERVAYTRWGEKMDAFGAPYYHIHRADFHKLLYELAIPSMTLRLNSTVVACDPVAPSLTLASGETVYGDLVIGADGVKSFIQQVVLGRVNPAQATGDAAYRALIPTSLMMEDPDLRPFVDVPEMTGWMGLGRHVMAYNVRAKREFNLVLIHPDDGSVESWTAEGSADKMRADFADFEPRIQKMLKLVKSTLKWRLMDRQPLETWIHPVGRVALLGDACHPMLPYRAQGAAMAIEDAAVLGNLLSHISSMSQVKPLLYAYESLRLSRTAETQASSRLNQKIFHLPDGPEQQERDLHMRAAMEAEFAMLDRERAGLPVQEDTMEGNPNQWADRKKSEIQFGYDADAEAERWWREVGEREVGPLGLGEMISGRL